MFPLETFSVKEKHLSREERLGNELVRKAVTSAHMKAGKYLFQRRFAAQENLFEKRDGLKRLLQDFDIPDAGSDFHVTMPNDFSFPSEGRTSMEPSETASNCFKCTTYGNRRQ